MATFYNQATLSYNGRLMNSNITTGEITNSLSAEKSVLSASYTANDSVLYAISLVNSGSAPIVNLAISDNLAAYTVGTETVYPLTYVDGSVKYYVNGVLQASPTTVSAPPLVISGLTIPASSNILILYETSTNEFTPISEGSTLTNIAVVSADGIEDITLSATLGARSYTNLNIAKAICPAVVTDNGVLTYTFIIQNSGNAPIDATDDVILTDTFTPILNPIAVTYNGENWSEGTNYTYDETTGEFATLPGNITIPAATFTQDTETGAFTVTPGVAIITVTGTV